MDCALCACGCGQLPKLGRKFIWGHNAAVRRDSAETRRKKSLAKLGDKNPMKDPEHAKAMRDAINSNPEELARRRQLMLDSNPMSKPGVKAKWYQAMLDGARFVQIAEGQTLPVGTIRQWVPSPYLMIKTEQGWQLHHRWVMEQHLGHELATGELVHHINEIQTDNRIENLEIMSRAEHARHHFSK